MARLVSFTVFRGAAYATTRNYYSEEGRIQQDQPASELPESEPPTKKRRRPRPSHIALSGFMAGRIGEPIIQQGNAVPTAFEGGAEL